MRKTLIGFITRNSGHKPSRMLLFVPYIAKNNLRFNLHNTYNTIPLLKDLDIPKVTTPRKVHKQKKMEDHGYNN